jgi:hypothetical protein
MNEALLTHDRCTYREVHFQNVYSNQRDCGGSSMYFPYTDSTGSPVSIPYLLKVVFLAALNSIETTDENGSLGA